MGPAEPEAADATGAGSSCMAAAAGSGGSAVLGMVPIVVRLGLAEEVALLEAVDETAEIRCLGARPDDTERAIVPVNASGTNVASRVISTTIQSSSVLVAVATTDGCGDGGGGTSVVGGGGGGGGGT